MASPLRRRVATGFAVLGAVVALAVGFGAFQFTLSMEERLVAQTLDAELLDYIARRQREPAIAPPSSQSLRTWVIGEGMPPPPVELLSLSDGLHRLTVEGRGWFVDVRRSGGLRFALMFDDAGIRVREDQLRRFLLAAGAITVFLAGAIGWWLAGRIIAPVRDLADRVGELDPRQRMRPVPGASRDDEIALLHDAFLAYQDRLADFVAREQAFTADASHELRTPVAVILGAIDVLRVNPDLTPAQSRAIERIGRAGADMQNLIDSLLRLAREKPERTVGSVACRIDQIIERTVERLEHLRASKPIRVTVQAEPVEVEADCRLLEVIVENLLRNALTYTEEGEVLVIANADGVSVRDSGPGIPEHEREKVFQRHFQGRPGGGAGIGLELASRVAARHHWKVELCDSEGGGAHVRLNLKPDFD